MIALGESLSNSSASVGDMDRFSFSLAQTPRVAIRTRKDGTKDNFDTQIELSDDNGSLIANNDDFGNDR